MNRQKKEGQPIESTKTFTSWTKRKFIYNASLAAAALPLMASDLSQKGDNAILKHTNVAENLLKGVSNIHIYANPNSGGRAINELDFDASGSYGVFIGVQVAAMIVKIAIPSKSADQTNISH